MMLSPLGCVAPTLTFRRGGISPSHDCEQSNSPWADADLDYLPGTTSVREVCEVRVGLKMEPIGVTNKSTERGAFACSFAEGLVRVGSTHGVGGFAMIEARDSATVGGDDAATLAVGGWVVVKKWTARRVVHEFHLLA